VQRILRITSNSYRVNEASFGVRTAFFVIVALVLCSATAQAAAPLETVALSGTAAPGTPNGVTFSHFPTQPVTQGFVPPSISAQGQVDFFGNLAGPNVSFDANDLGLWSGTPGNVSLVARINTLVGPGAGTSYAGFVLPGSLYNPLMPVPINANNQLLYDAFLTGNGVNFQNDEGLWYGSATAPTNIAREGNTPTGFPSSDTYMGGMYQTFTAPLINNAGHVAYLATLAGAQPAIFVGDPSALQIVAQPGQPAPGTPSGVTFSPYSNNGSILFSPAALGANDRVTFAAALSGPGGNFYNSWGIWTGTPGNVLLVARGGDQAPGLPSGTFFGSSTIGIPPFTNIEANGAGQVAFGSVAVTQSLSYNGSGLWAGTPGHLALVAAGGAQAPGMASGVTFNLDAFTSTIYSGPYFGGVVENAQGELAFAARADGTQHDGLWVGTAGHLNLIAQSGQQAPGVGSGLTFLSVESPSYLPTLGMNSAGQVAFVAELSDQSTGIWGTDRNGQLREVIHVGDTVQIAPGDFRSVTGLSFLGGSGNDDGRANGLSDNGQVTFYASFADGSSGIFVSNALTVPEPSTLILAALGGLALLAYRHRR
jgi:hypothetical protein